MPVLAGHVDRRHPLVDSGAIDDHVDLTERLQNRVARLGQRAAVQHVGRHAQRPAALGLDLLRDVLDQRLPPRGRDDVGTGVREAQRQYSADAAGSADDDGDSSF